MPDTAQTTAQDTATAERAAPKAVKSKTAPIADFAVAPENPRAHRPVEDGDALTANVAAYGVLQPVIAYTANGVHYVTAGRRRLSCAKAAGLAQLPYIALPRDEAIEAGLAEQVNHVAMHAADQVRAFSKMSAAGSTAEAIGNAFGLTATQVRRLVALGSLIEPILNAFAADKLDLRDAKIYANADPKEQKRLWDAFGKRGQHFRAREAMREGRVAATDELARYVGLKAYAAAGGHVDNDLFSIDGARFWGDDDDRDAGTVWLTDRKLLQKLADEKLEKALAKFRTQGWDYVEIRPQTFWDTHTTHTKPKTKAERAKFGLHVHIDRKGQLIAEAVTARTRKAAAKSKSRAAKAGDKAAGAKPPMTQKAHLELSLSASAIMSHAFTAQPDIAITALCAQLARQRWDSLGAGGEASSVLNFQTDWTRRPRPNDPPPPELSNVDKTVLEAETHWRRMFPASLVNAETIIAGWLPDVRTAFLGFLLAAHVDLAERFDPAAYKTRRARVAQLFEKAKAEPGALFTPTPELLKGFSVDELAKICAELKIAPGKTKTATAEAIAREAAGKAWAPVVLANMLGSGRPKAKAKAARPAAKKPARPAARKRKGKARP